MTSAAKVSQPIAPPRASPPASRRGPPTNAKLYKEAKSTPLVFFVHGTSYIRGEQNGITISDVWKSQAKVPTGLAIYFVDKRPVVEPIVVAPGRERLEQLPCAGTSLDSRPNKSASERIAKETFCSPSLLFVLVFWQLWLCRWWRLVRTGRKHSAWERRE